MTTVKASTPGYRRAIRALQHPFRFAVDASDLIAELRTNELDDDICDADLEDIVASFGRGRIQYGEEITTAERPRGHLRIGKKGTLILIASLLQHLHFALTSRNDLRGKGRPIVRFAHGSKALGTSLKARCKPSWSVDLSVPFDHRTNISMQSSSRRVVWDLMRAVGAGSSSCPCHSPTPLVRAPKCNVHPNGKHGHDHSTHRRGLATPKEPDTDYAFEMAASNIRYGAGVTAEVGMDFKHLRSKKVALFTDANVARLPPVLVALESLRKAGVQHVVYDRVRIEPTDASFKDAIDFVKRESPDAFLAVGGGSVIDTAKAANLYLTHPDNDFLDFVNAPIGKGMPVVNKVMPLIAVPTTAGTGSETTGVAIFDYEPKSFKTGIASRALKPLLGIVDPVNTRTMPPEVHVSSGLDVLCHAMESYTAIPYNQRSPRPTDPILRPAYQGSNPISDMWSLKALRMCVENLPKVYKPTGNEKVDREAQEQMILASTFAGIGFGNAGVHLCHGMSYPIAGLNKGYKHKGYNVDHKIIPHGISVAVTSPAVFDFTASACPERHLEVAEIFGANVEGKSGADAGKILADALRKFLDNLDVPNGLTALGFKSSQVGDLVEGTLPQVSFVKHRVTKLAPHLVNPEILERLFESSFKLY
ncbi:Hydroxyacid-oxoacid transhydrogenase, mitochondrial [Irineochytrium annulatum]|nr:Hydroxyacid-oxoacid transhydrogenase, mitochondrial [Irineochytrium annulatum]